MGLPFCVCTFYFGPIGSWFERGRERELEFLVFQWEIETEGERDSREIEEARFKPFLTVKS